GQRLSRAARDRRALERGARRAGARRSDRHAAHRERRPQPRAHHVGLPDASPRTAWRREPVREPQGDMLGLPFTTLSYANGPGYTGASPEQREGPKHYPHTPSSYKGIRRGRADLRHLDTTDRDYLQEATAPAGNETHGGADVPIYATGPGAWLGDG